MGMCLNWSRVGGLPTMLKHRLLPAFKQLAAWNVFPSPPCKEKPGYPHASAQLAHDQGARDGVEAATSPFELQSCLCSTIDGTGCINRPLVHGFNIM